MGYLVELAEKLEDPSNPDWVRATLDMISSMVAGISFPLGEDPPAGLQDALESIRHDMDADLASDEYAAPAVAIPQEPTPSDPIFVELPPVTIRSENGSVLLDLNGPYLPRIDPGRAFELGVRLIEAAAQANASCANLEPTEKEDS